MFSTLSPWTRAALARSPIPSKFSPRSVSSSSPHLLQYSCFYLLRLSLQDSERIVGCTGSPADSHDVLWLRVTTEKPSRCLECGSGVCFPLCCSSLLTTLIDVFHSVRYRLCTRGSGCVGSCPSRTRACALISREKP
jgi:hypothetical protein